MSGNYFSDRDRSCIFGSTHCGTQSTESRVISTTYRSGPGCPSPTIHVHHRCGHRRGRKSPDPSLRKLLRSLQGSGDVHFSSPPSSSPFDSFPTSVFPTNNDRLPVLHQSGLPLVNRWVHLPRVRREDLVPRLELSFLLLPFGSLSPTPILNRVVLDDPGPRVVHDFLGEPPQLTSTRERV